jgi:hypothetical protein
LSSLVIGRRLARALLKAVRARHPPRGEREAPQLDRLSDIAAGPIPSAGPIPGLVLHRFRIRTCRMQLAGFSRRGARRLRARGQATLDDSLGGMLELMNSS